MGALPQTDGRTLRGPRGEIYLQNHTAEMEGGGGRESGDKREQWQKKSRGRGGTKREARAEPVCAKRQASLRQAHRKQTESVHYKCSKLSQISTANLMLQKKIWIFVPHNTTALFSNFYLGVK